MEQQKALAALEPFIALSKTATSPRAAAELITRATSAPNTFIFSELLHTPSIQALATAGPEFQPHLKLLEIFSRGTYACYLSTPGLPALSAAQALKLRQLSLLGLARDRHMLTYPALREALNVPTDRALEEVVVEAASARLLDVTLDPHHRVVQVQRVAALRDPVAAPDDSLNAGNTNSAAMEAHTTVQGTITATSSSSPKGVRGGIVVSVTSGSEGGLITVLNQLRACANRCDATLTQLEARISHMRGQAEARGAASHAWAERIRGLVAEREAGRTQVALLRKPGTDPHDDPKFFLPGGLRNDTSGMPIFAALVCAGSGSGLRNAKRGSGHIDEMESLLADGQNPDAMDVDEEGAEEAGESSKKRANRRKM